jgi:hypothetical protein
MRRSLVLVAAAAALLAACGRETASGPAAGPGGFPAITARYAADYEMRDSATGAVTMQGQLYRDGAERMRFDMVQNGQPVAVVFDAANRRSLMFRTGPDAPRAALVMPHQDDGLFDQIGRWDDWDGADGAAPTKVGEDTVAGLRCDVWRSPAEEGEAAHEACVTRDGVLLRSGAVGAAHPDMIATQVTPGAPDAALFAIPAGYEVIDYSPCMDMQAAAMEAAKAGQRPDMDQMQQCMTLGQRAAEIMGGMGE